MRKTKIICTLGPASDSPEMIRQLMLSGMNGARFNFSHATHEYAKEKLAVVKQLRAGTETSCGHHFGYQRPGNPDWHL